MSRSFALKPMPSLRAYQIPCYSHGPVHSYAFAGRLHRLRRRRLLSRGRSSTLWPEEARAARRDDVTLDRGHLHLFCRQMHAFVAFHRPAQPALCSRPSCSPGHRSSCSLLFSSGAARRRGGRRAVEAGALEHIPAESLRAVQTALPGRKFRRLRRAESDRGGRRMALSAPSCVAFLPSLGVLF